MKISEEVYSYAEMKDIIIHAGWLGNKEDLSPFAKAFTPILKNLGFVGSIRQVIDALPYQAKYIDLVDFLNTMVNLGFKVNTSDASFKKMDARLTPCLFFPFTKLRKRGNPIVIIKKEDDQLEVFDPYTEETQIITVNHFTNKHGQAYFFKELTNFDTDEETITSNIPPTAMAWLRNIFFRFKSLFIQVIFINIISNLFSLGSPLFVMYVYDKIIGSRAIDILWPIVMGALLAVGLDSILREVKSRLFSWFSCRIDNIISQVIFERLLLFGPKYTETASTSSQVSRMKDFDSVREFFGGGVGITLFEIPFTFIYLVALAIIGGPLIEIPLLLILAYIILGIIINNKIDLNLETSARAGSMKQTLLVETLTRLRSIRSIGANKTWYERFRLLSGSSSYSGFRQAVLSSILEGLAYFFSIAGGLATLVVGINLVWEGTITPGSLIASMIIIWKIINPFQTVCISLSRIRQIFKSITQVHRLLLIPPEMKSSEIKSTTLEMEGNIEFNQVGLRYTNDSNPVLSGFNINIKKGELIAISGPNGCGKTSIIKLIIGMYSPQAGSVRIDGVDIRQLPPIELRRNISYIPQRASLYSGTVAQNIRLSDPTASDDKILYVLKKLGIEDEIEELPGGINFPITNPESLPYALKYYISMARSLILNPKILLIDEIPPRILNGPKGEQIIKYLFSSKGKRTICFISPRTELLLMADKLIYLVGNGQAAFGKPEEILGAISH